jgi:hypothetical protein
MLYKLLQLQCEDYVKSLQFPATTIWQPGLLGRDEKARFNEKIFSWITRAVSTTTKHCHSKQLQETAKTECLVEEVTCDVYKAAIADSVSLCLCSAVAVACQQIPAATVAKAMVRDAEAKAAAAAPVAVLFNKDINKLAA